MPIASAWAVRAFTSACKAAATVPRQAGGGIEPYRGSAGIHVKNRRNVLNPLSLLGFFDSSQLTFSPLHPSCLSADLGQQLLS